MKRIFMALLASAALFAGCTKDNTEVQDGGQTALIPVRFTVDQVATRVSGTAFEVGDQVGMFITKTGEQAPYVDNVKFTVTESGVLEPDAPVYYPADRSRVSVVAYYPYSDGGKTVIDVDLAADQSEQIADASLYRAEQNVTPSADAVALNFTPALSIVKLYTYEVPFDENEMKISFAAAVKGSIDLATGECTYEDTANVLPCKNDDHFEVVVLPQTLAAGSKVTVASDNEKYVFTLPNDFILSAGTSNDIELNLDPDAVRAIDLSANGTSNCYVVNTPGTVYKFKATVKGNGVDPLGDNASITPVKARILWGQQKIIAPKDGWPENNGDDNTLSKSVVYSSVSVKRGYVYFTTAENMEDANIFIAVMDENDNVLWDWHIWCVNGWEPDATTQTVTTKDINSTMMDRNLGAFSNPAAIAEPTFQDYVSARGLYYQWGRKDPFPGFRTMSGYNSYVAWSEPNGEIKTSITWYGGTWNDSFIKTNDAAGLNFSTVSQTLDYIAANPQVFIAKGATTSTWVVGTADPGAGTTTDWGKLWGNQSNKAVGSKTMYDPCPLGYMVPSTNQLRFVTSHNDNISATYSATDPWKLNCKETIYNAAGVNVGNGESADGKGVNPFYNPPYGLNFYIHGVKTALVEGDADYDASAKSNVGKAPADATVSYFPSQGWLYYTGSIFGVNTYKNQAQILIHSNAPSSSTIYGGLAYKMRASHTGDFWYSAQSASYADPMPTGMPVRCVKE